MKILSKEFAVRFYALVFHMVHGESARVQDSQYDLDAKMFYKFKDIFGMIVIRVSDFEGFGC